MSIETCKRFSALTGWNTAYSNGNKVSPKVTPDEQWGGGNGATREAVWKLIFRPIQTARIVFSLMFQIIFVAFEQPVVLRDFAGNDHIFICLLYTSTEPKQEKSTSPVPQANDGANKTQVHDKREPDMPEHREWHQTPQGVCNWQPISAQPKTTPSPCSTIVLWEILSCVAA